MRHGPRPLLTVQHMGCYNDIHCTHPSSHMISDWEINTPVAIEKMATAQTMVSALPCQ